MRTTAFCLALFFSLASLAFSAAAEDEFGDEFGSGTSTAAPASGSAPESHGPKIGGHTRFQYRYESSDINTFSVHDIVLTVDNIFGDWMQLNAGIIPGNAMVVGPAWLEVEFAFHPMLGLRVGRLIVPFGYLYQGMHHLYGARPGPIVGTVWAQDGVMLHGEVAPFGMNLNYMAYVFNSASGSAKQKAFGGRTELSPFLWLKWGLSGYYDIKNDQMHLPQYRLGSDLSVKFWILQFQGDFIRQLVDWGQSSQYYKQGWFGEVRLQLLESLAGFFRYGETDTDSRVKDNTDEHTTAVVLRWNLPLNIPTEVFLEGEYRWIMEAVNEKDNDQLQATLWIYF
jgi:hypothetical protein